MTPFVIIIGPAQHGKSTFRTKLAQVLGVHGGSCSDHLYALWSLLDGNRGPEVLKQLPKEQVRTKLVKLGNWLTSDGDLTTGFPYDEFPGADLARWGKCMRRHPASLIQAAYRNGIRVLDGVRRQTELDAALPQFDWFGMPPFFVWVEDPRKQRLESDNLDIHPSIAHHIVLNDGSLHDLELKVYETARKIWRESDLDA